MMTLVAVVEFITISIVVSLLGPKHGGYTNWPGLPLR
jgi:hypothetical protein